MTFEQLRVFVAVAERQHMTRASEALHMAQSAASAAIAGLEGRYGARLFDRVGRGIELTEAGHLFLVEARIILARVEAAELLLAEIGSLARGTLTVRASQTIGSYWLPRHLVDFRKRYPQITLQLGIGNTAQVAASVRDGTAELGFVEGTVNEPALDSEVVAHDQLVLVVGDGHPWQGRQDVSGSELAAANWVLREPGSGTRGAMETALKRLGVTGTSLAGAMALPSNEAVRSAVECGAGATVISASVAAPGLEAGLLHQVPLDLPQREFRVLHHSERHRSRAAQALLGLVGGPRPQQPGPLPLQDGRGGKQGAPKIPCSEARLDEEIWLLANG